MLRLPRDLLDAMVAHCQREHPIEACGVIAGSKWTRIPSRLIEMDNAAHSATRYVFDPEAQLAVWQDMEDRSELPLVIYHSHTATEAVPSGPDVAYAAEPEAHYVIVSTRGELPEVRSYRVADGAATEELIKVPAEAGHFLVGGAGGQQAAR